ncbi:PspC domain-containing protein [Candidatus Saccharibacteria bacterium RIFCSPHIGHO2_12_FULL_49_19]|nr:MAG: PspC domain-containing protein [Candidatus Saccharibacteria bacterium RIFCSPHIGHO2_12_FULL_49_19]OGL38017.1 MAG: PspC domain-containing protein [Candidatus Saccharibacteria bacterium RIFCSPLOWO2_01_FULL_49_22]
MSKNSTKTNSFKRLYLSSKDKKVFGVCGGLGEYFGVDPTLIRLAWIILALVTAIVPGIIAYIIAALVIPKAAESG